MSRQEQADPVAKLSWRSLGMEEHVGRLYRTAAAAVGRIVRWKRGKSSPGSRALAGGHRSLRGACIGMGSIYRGKRLVNWDPVLKTALSDLEVVSEEEDGHLWHLKYPLRDGTGISSSQRPAGDHARDSAVAVHPDDERLPAPDRARVRLPLADRKHSR